MEMGAMRHGPSNRCRNPPPTQAHREHLSARKIMEKTGARRAELKWRKKWRVEKNEARWARRGKRGEEIEGA